MSLIRLTLSISGMHCDHCTQAVRESLEALPGVQVEAVETGRAVVALDERTASKSDVASAIRRTGEFDITGFTADSPS